MDVNEHKRLSNFNTRTQIKVKEQSFYCCSTLHRHSWVFNNEHTSCPEMIVKQPPAVEEKAWSFS
jgi:hypothetical protein